MTIDERSVTQALRAYAEGVDMTDTDLDRLEAQLEERLQEQSALERRRLPLQLAVAACAVAGLVLAAAALWRTGVDETMPAAPTTPSLTTADLAGVWMVEQRHSAGHLWHFSAGGGRDTTSDPRELFDLAGESFEPYVLEPGGVVSLDDDGAACRATAGSSAEGRMSLTPLEGQPDCGPFVNGEAWSFVRVSPVSVAGAALVQRPNSLAPSPARVVESVNDVSGTWLLQGTGTILGIAADSADGAEYLVDDDGDVRAEADQRGTVTLGPDGRVVLHPTEGTGQGCDTVYEGVLTTGTTLEAELADTSCGRVGGAGSTWVRLN